MAIYHCNISNVSRAKGSSCCATLSYAIGEKVKDERLDKTFSFGREERVVMTGTILPEHAPKEFQNPKVLFNSIEKYETSDNARTGKKIKLAFPREFTPEQQKEVIENFIKNNITSKGYACTYAIHTDKENNNPHPHILIANRQINEKGEWEKVKTKSEFVKDKDGNKIPIIDEKTGEQKVRIREGKGAEKLWKRHNVSTNPLDRKEVLQEIRENWAKECNKYLAPEQQIDHRSYQERGIEQIPTIHEGYAARAMEQRGEVSERCQYNREVRAINQEIIENRAFIEVLKETDSRLQDLKSLETGNEKYGRYNFAYDTVTRTLEQERNIPILSCQDDSVFVASKDTPTKALDLLKESKERWNSFIGECREQLKIAQKSILSKSEDKSTLEPKEPQKSLTERFKGWFENRSREREERKALEMEQKRKQAEELARKQAEKKAVIEKMNEPVAKYDYPRELEKLEYVAKVWKDNRETDGDWELREQAFKKLGEITDLKTKEYDPKLDWWSERSSRDVPPSEIEEAISKTRNRLKSDIAYVKERAEHMENYRKEVAPIREKIRQPQERTERETKHKSKGGHER